MDHREWDENHQVVDSPFHLPGDLSPQGDDAPVLVAESEPEEDSSMDLKEELERKPVESIADVTPIEDDEPVESPVPISYYFGSRIPRDRKHAHRSISTCGGVKKNP
ncbi:unnamed protein product [Lactuca virosa]|uniref:Uncharacterized protein n=1 Tax=Lactuca virosa TaxID=75947 RepID=A0AAU9LY72_9ASTR|nr:unnamed protein product [Lactuca virosa]